MLRVLTLSTLFPDATRRNFGIFVEQQTLALTARGDVAVRVVAPIGIPPWPLSRLRRYHSLTELPRHESWKGLEVDRPRFLNLPGTGGRFHAPCLAHAIAPLLERIRPEFPFDLIDAEFFFPEGPAAVALGKRFRVPVSIMARGSDVHRWARKPATARQVIGAGNAAEGVLAVSAAMRRDMMALGFPERTGVSLTGVDQDRFAPRDRAAEKARLGVAGPLVVSLGALIALKGHDIVIDAVAGLPDVTLLIAGEGPERPRLAAQIARHGIGKRVRLLGAVPHGEIPALVGAADVMALASASEGLANAWVEAIASGTPVVIPDVGGAREVVRDARAGRITARDVEAFRAAIAGLLADPIPADQVREAARPFTWQANAAHLRDHFAALVEAYRAGQRQTAS